MWILQVKDLDVVCCTNITRVLCWGGETSGVCVLIWYWCGNMFQLFSVCCASMLMCYSDMWCCCDQCYWSVLLVCWITSSRYQDDSVCKMCYTQLSSMLVWWIVDVFWKVSSVCCHLLWWRYIMIYTEGSWSGFVCCWHGWCVLCCFSKNLSKGEIVVLMDWSCWLHFMQNNNVHLDVLPDVPAWSSTSCLFEWQIVVVVI